MKFLGLVIGIVSSVIAGTSRMAAEISDSKQAELPPRWTSYTASGAQGRREQVERDMQPNVVFDGETKPVSVESRLALYRTPALSVACRVREGAPRLP